MKKYPFFRFQLSELHLALKLVINFLSPLKESSTEVVPLLNKLTHLFNKYDQALKKKHSSAYTDVKKEQDVKQDEGFLSFREFVHSCSYSIINPTLREPSLRIMEAIKRHGWSLHSFSYKDQMATSISLINELKREALSSDMITIGALELFNGWNEATESFHTISQTKVAEKAQDSGEAATDLRKEVIYWLDKSLVRIDDMVVWESSDEWVEIYKNIEEALDGINTAVKGRITRKKHEVEASEQAD
ncbi:MAG: hypothetical protein JEZ14_10530 [Marinilabiliaceae bacterium]|nr:hypothetical protein [Marinilabiliaceae bacterium]